MMKDKDGKQLHQCMKAPNDYLSWKYMNEGERCFYCGKVMRSGVMVEEIRDNS